MPTRHELKKFISDSYFRIKQEENRTSTLLPEYYNKLDECCDNMNLGVFKFKLAQAITIFFPNSSAIKKENWEDMKLVWDFFDGNDWRRRDESN